MTKSKIVHIGYPKTGTTFLQQEVFPRYKDVRYVDFHRCVPLFNDIIYTDPLDFDEEKFQNELDQYKSEKPVLFSYESLTGSPFIYKGLNRSSIISRLRQAGFDKLIITVRNQNTALDSYYRQYVAQGGTMKFRHFASEDVTLNTRPFTLDYLKYDRMVDLCYKEFGRENILVICQESLKTELKESIDQISRFIGVEAPDISPSKQTNASMSNLAISLVRFFNHFLFSMFNPSTLFFGRFRARNFRYVVQLYLDPWLLRPLSSKRKYGSKSEQLANYYKESNQRLETLTGLPLHKHGYPL